ncbi:MAG: class I SAM-dependent methyltransferase [Clostridia bacterium]|nr:class I SAM-dependent methyltransferase [Clostridia bacterium]
MQPDLYMPERVGKVQLDYRWFDERERYSDGDEVEDFLLKMVQEKRDPWQVLRQDHRWPVLYHLTPGRTVITEPMRILPTDRVLEIGAGMGAITGALAQRAAGVDCVELSLQRSLVNAYRHQAQEGIRIIVGNYESIPFQETYEVVTLIGVLEYAGMYIHQAQHPAQALLKSICHRMKPGARLYIAIENRLGMKYFAGCPEDHLAYSFVGIEGYHTDVPIRTYSRQELIQLLAKVGFADPVFWYPFPDYKLPSVIYSEESLRMGGIPAVANYDLHRYRVFDEQKAMSSMTAEEFGVFANSFLVEVIKR